MINKNKEKIKFIMFLLSESDKKLIENAAAEQRLSLSGFCRQLILNHINEEKKVIKN